MAVATACVAIAEFIELIFHCICILYMLLFTKSHTATPVKILNVRNDKSSSRYEYQAIVSCGAEEKESKLAEIVKEGKNANFF